MKKAKHLALTLASIMLVGSLAACGGNNNAGNNGGKENAGNNASSTNTPAAEETSKPAEKVELSFWTLGNVNYEELANEYTKEHPNVTIKIQNTGDQTAHHNNLTTALSAGSGAPTFSNLKSVSWSASSVPRTNSIT